MRKIAGLTVLVAIIIIIVYWFFWLPSRNMHDGTVDTTDPSFPGSVTLQAEIQVPHTRAEFEELILGNEEEMSRWSDIFTRHLTNWIYEITEREAFFITSHFDVLYGNFEMPQLLLYGFEGESGEYRFHLYVGFEE